MSDFYAINDPAHQDKIKHEQKYLIVDDWDNVLYAEYDNIVDAFRVVHEDDRGTFTTNYIMDEGIYMAEGSGRFTSGCGVICTEYDNPLPKTKIMKFMPFPFDLAGHKL